MYRFLFDGRVTMHFLYVYALALDPSVGLSDGRFRIRLNDDLKKPIAFSLFLGSHVYLKYIRPSVVGGPGVTAWDIPFPKVSSLEELLGTEKLVFRDEHWQLLQKYVDSVSACYGKIVPWMSTVGCRKGCHFCIMRYNVYRRLPADFVKKWILAAYECGYRHFACCNADLDEYDWQFVEFILGLPDTFVSASTSYNTIPRDVLSCDRVLVRVGVENIESPKKYSSRASIEEVSKHNCHVLLYLKHDNVDAYALKVHEKLKGTKIGAFISENHNVSRNVNEQIPRGAFVSANEIKVMLPEWKPSRKVVDFWNGAEMTPIKTKVANRIFRDMIHFFYGGWTLQHY